MAYHHIAIATRDLEATHRFYTEAMGFTLAKVVVAPTPEAGWAKHVFYDTGDGTMFAVWDLHLEALADYPTAISTALGLPMWTNHIAFGATDLDDIAARRERLLAHGCDVAEIDHEWCTSIYANDPNGVMVEFCTTTREFTTHDYDEAAMLLNAADPPLSAPPEPVFYEAAEHTAGAIS